MATDAKNKDAKGRENGAPNTDDEGKRLAAFACVDKHVKVSQSLHDFSVGDL